MDKNFTSIRKTFDGIVKYYTDYIANYFLSTLYAVVKKMEDIEME